MKYSACRLGVPLAALFAAVDAMRRERHPDRFLAVAAQRGAARHA
jgi:predicted outer membrane lipoprotein